jgi:hypothetical protein
MFQPAPPVEHACILSTEGIKHLLFPMIDPASTPELVFGLVGPLGTDLSAVAQSLKDALAQVRYDSEIHRLSHLLRDLAGEPWNQLQDGPRDATIEAHMTAGNKLRQVETWNGGVEVVPPSYVTIRVKSSLIREGPLQPPVVRRCLVGNGVLQKQRTGRVVQVEAVALELRDMGEAAARQWRNRSSARMAPSAFRTTKERTGKPDSTKHITACR